MKIRGSVTHATEQGPRWHQEDRYFYTGVVHEGSTGMLMAVMDGHRGDTASEFCLQHVRKFFSIEKGMDAESALRNLVSALAKATTDLYSGTTLTVAYVDHKQDQVSLAIVGDSPAIVIDKNKKVHVSRVHNVRTNLAERRVAEKRGGFYSKDGYVFAPNGNHGLQLSRSLGDSQMDGVTSREPEVYTIKSPRWIALLTDGILEIGRRHSKELIKKFVELSETKATAVKLLNCVKVAGLKDNATVVLWKA